MLALRSIVLFYKSFAFANIVVTLICMSFVFLYGSVILGALIWIKALTLTVTFFYINNYKKKELFYYKNLGVAKVLLWGTTLSFDLVLFVVLFVITMNLK